MNKKLDIGIPHATLLAIFAAVLALPMPAWIMIMLFLWLGLSLVALLMMADSERRDFIAGTLRHSKFTQIYRRFTNGTVGYFWDRFCDNSYSGKNPIRIFRHALTWRLYDRALLIAVVYPVLLLVAVWIVTGNVSKLGELTTVPVSDFWPKRALSMIAVALAFITMLGEKSFVISPNRKVRIAWQTISIASIIIANIAFSYLDQTAEIFPIVAIAIVVFAANIVNAERAAFPNASFRFFSGGSLLSLSGAIAFAIVGFGTLPMTVNTLTIYTVIIVGTFEVIKQDAIGEPEIARFIATLGILLGVLYFLKVINWREVSSEKYGLFLFLGVLPLINGIFDVVSYAVTLTLLRLGQLTRQPFFLGLIDLAIAMLLFLGLGGFLVAVITAMNALAGVPLFDLAALFDGIKAHPSEYYWLYLMMFSTLLPTALHMGVAVLGVQAVTPKPIRRRVAGLVSASPDKSLEATFAPLFVGAVWTAPFVALGALVYGAAMLFGEWGALVEWVQSIGWWYFDRLRDLAASLGNVV